MGGQQGGDVASAMAVAGVAESLRGLKPSSEALRHCIEEINRAIFLRQMQEVELGGMGTTLTILWEDRESVILGHVGDSRAYLLHTKPEQLTRDHSVVQEMVDTGRITPDEAKVHPSKNIITRALGVLPEIRVDFCEQPMGNEDILLLCTDGLTNFVADADIFRLAKTCGDKNLPELLVERALENGGGDNVTAVTIGF